MWRVSNKNSYLPLIRIHRSGITLTKIVFPDRCPESDTRGKAEIRWRGEASGWCSKASEGVLNPETTGGNAALPNCATTKPELGGPERHTRKNGKHPQWHRQVLPGTEYSRVRQSRFTVWLVLRGCGLREVWWNFLRGSRDHWRTSSEVRPGCSHRTQSQRYQGGRAITIRKCPNFCRFIL